MSRTSNMIFYFALLFSPGLTAPNVWANDHQKCCEKHAAIKDRHDFCVTQFCAQSSGCDERETKEDSSSCPKDMFFKKMCAILSHEEELSLSEEQMSALKSLKLKTQKDLILKKAETQVNDLDIKTQMWEDKWDADSLNSLIDRKFDLSKEEAKILVGSMTVLQSTLTQEQTRILTELCGEGKKNKGHCPVSSMKMPGAPKKDMDGGVEMKKDAMPETGTMDVPVQTHGHPSVSVPSPVPMNEEKADSMDEKMMMELDQNMENTNSTTY